MDPKHSAFTPTGLPPWPQVTSRTVFGGCACSLSHWFTVAGWYSALEVGVEDWTVEERTLTPGDRVRSLLEGFVVESLYRSDDQRGQSGRDQLAEQRDTFSNDSLCGVALDALKPQALRHNIYIDNIGIIGLD